MVTPAQAGDTLSCPQCQQPVAVPKLGELRQLPRIDAPSEEVAGERPESTRSVAMTISFVGLTLLALMTLIIGGYNGIRWVTTGSEMTTERHLEEIETMYENADAATMIVHFENMEENSLDLVMPYNYQIENNEKAQWGRNSAIAFGFAVVFGVGAVISARKT